MRRSRLISFIAGGLVGCTLGTAGAGTLLVKHPHLYSRLLRGANITQPVAPPGNLSDVTVRVDSSARGRAINPLIYGVSGADEATLRQLGATSNRWGGNNQSRYNWANGHAWNAARDWEYRNGNYGKQGLYADRFIDGTRAASAQPVITIPTLGWVARDDNNQTRSLGVPGNGGPPLAPDTQAIAGYDPAANQLRTSVPSMARKPGPLSDPPDPTGTVYQNEWVHHLAGRYGAAPDGVSYYAMDNEPDLWSLTHADVHPAQMSYDQMLSNFEDYATAVKEQDPKAMILGPDSSGWTAYEYSARDRGTDNFATHADRRAHGDQAFLSWWLGQVAAADSARKSRSLDYLDVHYYPQGNQVYSGAHDPVTEALRIRSTQSLYDSRYTDESWINANVMLIPRLRKIIDQRYPGTKLAITEYNWGGEKDVSGGIALAEVLGSFGREGVDLATYFQYPPVQSPAGAAFRMYRNLDGRGAAFGDIALPATSNQNGVTAFAARHSNGGEVDVMLVNESPDRTASVRLDLGLRGHPRADGFRIDNGSSRIDPVAIASLDSAQQLPPYSITMLRVVNS